ncbi:MAG: DUF11 domain-containing protein, partial [Runella slithyformis]
MKTLFTTIENHKPCHIAPHSGTCGTNIAHKSFNHFLIDALSCIKLLLPQNRMIFPQFEVATSEIERNTALKYGKLDDEFIDFGTIYESPPPEYPPSNLLTNHTPNTSFQPIIPQIMSQLSIPLPQSKPRTLGTRFDEKSKQWVSFSQENDNLTLQNDSKSFGKAHSSGILTNRLFQICLSGMLFFLTSIVSFAQATATKTDLSLKKSVNNPVPGLNGTMKFTVWTKNESNVTVTNIIVKDEFPSTAATIVGTPVTTGASTFNVGTGQWTIPSLAAGDSVKLEITATAIARGVFFNKAEVMSMGTQSVQFEDEDSTPNNKVLGEDDYATACFSVPLFWYRGDEYAVTPDAVGYSRVVWTKVGKVGPITGVPSDSARVSGDTLYITGTGRFAFSAEVSTCPATGCCEIIVIPGPLGSIGDLVWKDLNNNGRQDNVGLSGGEPGVAGVKVYLLKKVGATFVVSDSVVTAGNGRYLFTGLEAGDYKVKFNTKTLPLGCIITSKQNGAGIADSLDSDADPTTGESQVVTLDPEKGGIDKDNLTVDAGLFSPLGSIGDLVFKDINNNGRQDNIGQAGGEPGVDGVSVVLYKRSGSTFSPVDTVLTSGGGKYLFNGLAAGDYKVMFDLRTFPVGCVLSPKFNQAGVPDSLDSDANPSTGESQVVTIDPTKSGIDKDNLTIDAGLFSPLGSIGDLVWKDLNDNGRQDNVGQPGGEAPVGGVKVFLLKRSGTAFSVIDSTVTASNGRYLFGSLSAGDYKVRFDSRTLPAGCVLSSKQNAAGVADSLDSDVDSGTGESQVVTIDPTKTGIDKDNLTIDAGLFSPIGSIGNFVWKDRNDNGRQDAGEPGLNGVKVILWTG